MSLGVKTCYIHTRILFSESLKYRRINYGIKQGQIVEDISCVYINIYIYIYLDLE